MDDPMDRNPVDHGSDRFDYVEVDGGEGQDLPEWLTMDYMPCPDCRANLFLRWTGTDWHSTVAHDESCPTLRTMRRRP